MIGIDAETFAVLNEYDPERAVGVTFVAIDGTHSSGKSTLFDNFLETEGLVYDPENDYLGKLTNMLGHRFREYCVIKQIDDVQVPIVAIPEQATLYDFDHPLEHSLTDGFSRIDQAAITRRTFSNITGAAMKAAHLATQLQPHGQYPIAMVLSDRTTVSGFSYAETRLPEENHDVVSFDEIALFDGMLMGRGIPDLRLREWSNWLGRLCDSVIITDYSEIPLEDNGLRSADLAFRRLIHDVITSDYLQLTGSNKIHQMNGLEEERRQKLDEHITALLQGRIAAADRV